MQALADIELSYKTTYDPVYSYVVDSTATKDETMFNSTDLVGKLWWDIDAVRLINPYANTGNIFTAPMALILYSQEQQ